MASKFIKYTGELDTEYFGDWMDRFEPGIPVIYEENGVTVHSNDASFIKEKMEEAIKFYKSSGMM